MNPLSTLMMWLILLMVAWWLFWALVILIVSRGRITPLELVAESFLVAATITETGTFPDYRPGWRDRRNSLNNTEHKQNPYQ